MTDLASLVVNLTAETSQYTAAIKKASDDISGFSDNVGSSINDVAKNLLGLEALKQVFDFTDSIFKSMQSFEVLSHAIGATTEDLSQLSFAAKLENVGDISYPFERLARSVGAAQEGNQKLTDTFAALGVKLTDANGKLKSTNDQFLGIADQVSKYNDSLVKTALIQTIFGRSGADFIAFLDQGADKIKAAKEEAIELGVSISTTSAQGAHEFEQNITRIGSAVTGVFYKALTDVLPVLQSVTDSMVEFSKNADSTSVAVEEVAAGFKVIASALIAVGALFQALGKIIAIAFIEPIQLAKDVIGNISDFIDDQIAILSDLGDAYNDVVADIKAVITELNNFVDVLAHPIDAINTLIGKLDDLRDTISHPIDALKSLKDELDLFPTWVVHPIDSAKQFGNSVADAFTHPASYIVSFTKSIADSAVALAEQNRNLETYANAFLHPIDAIKAYLAAQRAAFTDSPLADVIRTLTKGAASIGDIWSDTAHELDEIVVTAKKIKPDLIAPDENALRALESGIDSLGKLNDKLNEQVATYGLSSASAQIYDITLGKLSATVAELNKATPDQLTNALYELEKQGKLSADSIALIKAATDAGVPAGEAFKNVVIANTNALDQLKSVDALSKLDSQLLTMTGHLQEAAKAAFDLANRPLTISIKTQQDTQQFSGLTASQQEAAAATQLLDINRQAIDVQDQLSRKMADTATAGLAAGDSALKIAGDEAAVRQTALDQFEQLYIKAQALANVQGLPVAAFKSATEQAQLLRSVMGSIQFNPKIVEDVAKAIDSQKQYNEVLKQEKSINDDLSLQLAQLDKQKSQGSVTDLEYMAKQDDARQHEIDQLTVIQAQLLDIVNNNPGNAQALDEYKKLGVTIDQLETQIGQLARTVRDDLTDAASNAFTDFATGAKDARDALNEFVQDFTKEMIQLAAKSLFQKLFETTGITSGINSIFGATRSAVDTATALLPATSKLIANDPQMLGIGSAASSASGLANTTEAATSLSTAITTAAATGGTALGTGITTAADVAGTAIGTAIEAAGDIAADAMAAAIEAASTVEDVAALAGGGPIPANQIVLVGEEGPELLVTDSGETSAATATQGGTVVPSDLTHAHVIGTDGPEYIRSNASGFVIPSDTFLSALADRSAPTVSQPVVTPDVTEQSFSRPATLETEKPRDDVVRRDFSQPAVLQSEQATDAQPVRTPVESRGAPPLESLLTSNVIAFPTPVPRANEPALPVDDDDAISSSNVVAFLPPQQDAISTAVDSSIAQANDATRRHDAVSSALAAETFLSPAARTDDVTHRHDNAISSTTPGIDFPTPAFHADRLAPELNDDDDDAISSSNVLSFSAPTRQANQVASELDDNEDAFPSSLSNVVPIALYRQLVEINGPDSVSPFQVPESQASETSPVETSPAATSNVLPFLLPQPKAPDDAFIASTLDAISSSPSVPDRLDTEVTRAAQPVVTQSLDPSTSAIVMKFEKVIKHEQSHDMLDASEYEALLTDRYLQKRQSGGPVNAGQPYLVGEGGPELLVPDSSGTVMTSWQNSGNTRGGTVINQVNHFAISTPTGKVDKPSQSQIASRIAMATQLAGRNS